MYRVIEKAQTISGSWQVMLEISKDNTAILKFNSEPSDSDIQLQAEIYNLQYKLAQLTGNSFYQEMPEKVRLSKLDYMNRFTDEELVKIYSAAKESAIVEVWLEKFKLAEYVDTSDPNVLSGLETLEKVGLLSKGRALEISR